MNSTHEEYEKLGYILEMVGCFDEVNNYDYDDYAIIGELIHKLYYQLEKVFEGDGNGGMRYQYHTDMYNDTELMQEQWQAVLTGLTFVNREEAIKAYLQGDVEVYLAYYDNTTSLVESFEQLDNHTELYGVK
ncbi:gp21 [Brochothrix phage A9]|uniref:Gp21 n=1 Tax=Brochothrix phage A9 TaxID=857312 RepID=D9J0G8_9CAUD|nr:gp21 [Brochothrix phage A9]ADJ53063.1 gp21 [Brochothrix phage A9]